MHRWYFSRTGILHKVFLSVALMLVGAGLLATMPLQARAAIAPTVLGTAQSFAVLGGSTVTNTGPTVITGANVGVSPGSAITGFPPGVVTAPGTIHATDAVAAQAQSDVTTAYNTLAGQSCSANRATELGGLTLTAGTSCQATSGLTGTLTLDAQGDPNAVFVFKVASTLITASNSAVRVINGGSACNVYWQVGSSATLGTGTAFVGNILALTSISVTTGATVAGRALARNGAVTLDNNRFTPNACATAPINTPTNTPVASATTPPIATPTSPIPVTATSVSPSATSVAPSPTSISPIATPISPIATPVSPAPVIATPASPIRVFPTPFAPVAVIATPVSPIVTPTAPAGLAATPVAAIATPIGNVTTGGAATAAPLSQTLPLVGSPANAIATAPPIPVAMANTGGGGMATQFAAPASVTGRSDSPRILWMTALAALVLLMSAGLFFSRRQRR